MGNVKPTGCVFAAPTPTTPPSTGVAACFVMCARGSGACCLPARTRTLSVCAMHAPWRWMPGRTPPSPTLRAPPCTTGDPCLRSLAAGTTVRALCPCLPAARWWEPRVGIDGHCPARYVTTRMGLPAPHELRHVPGKGWLQHTCIATAIYDGIACIDGYCTLPFPSPPPWQLRYMMASPTLWFVAHSPIL